MLTAERARELLDYDPDTGLLTWRGAYTGVANGKVTGCPDSHGYLRVRLDQKLYKNHRVIWLIAYGSWPIGNIDHIDGNPANNRLENLRECSQRDNMQNQSTGRRKGTSKYLGVSFDKSKQKWRATISFFYKQTHIGYFDTEELAYDAYWKSKADMHAFNPAPRQSGQAASS